MTRGQIAMPSKETGIFGLHTTTTTKIHAVTMLARNVIDDHPNKTGSMWTIAKETGLSRDMETTDGAKAIDPPYTFTDPPVRRPVSTNYFAIIFNIYSSYAITLTKQ